MTDSGNIAGLARVELTKNYFSTKRLISRGVLRDMPDLVNNAEILIENHTVDMLIELHTYLMSAQRKAKETAIEAPADWWEHFKQRWAPKWFLRKYPVKMKHLGFVSNVTNYICPHTNTNWGNDKETHVAWLEGER
jgi:hypothetical protein